MGKKKKGRNKVASPPPGETKRIHSLVVLRKESPTVFEQGKAKGGGNNEFLSFF